MNVFVLGGLFLFIFRFLSIPIPGLQKIIDQYDAGSIWAPLIIGSIGALILATALLLLARSHLAWNSGDIYLVFGLYLAVALIGWLSLIKIREYTNEED
jgi:hypothetical protein